MDGCVPDKFENSLVEGSAKAKVTVPEGMTSGAFSLMVRDGAGTQSDQIRFTVKAPAKSK